MFKGFLRVFPVEKSGGHSHFVGFELKDFPILNHEAESSYEKIIAPPGFEPGSAGSKPAILDH